MQKSLVAAAKGSGLVATEQENMVEDMVNKD